MERANKIGAAAAIIIGEDELARGVASVKDLAKGTQSDVAIGDIAAHVRKGL
jgi:histidyl-tRNA synthetase